MLNEHLKSLIRLKYVKAMDIGGVDGFVFDNWDRCTKFIELILSKHLHRKTKVGFFDKGKLNPISITKLDYTSPNLTVNDLTINCSVFDMELGCYPVLIWRSDESIYVSFIVEKATADTDFLGALSFQFKLRR